MLGCSWGRCGRVEELRIRILARKFFKIWMRNTFGRFLPHTAKIHYDSVLLRKTFEGWKEEWWTSGREWSLSVCAQYHYRYYLLYTTFQSWQKYISLKVEKKMKIQRAQTLADRRRMRQIWDKWKLYIHKRRVKSKAFQLARDQHRHKMLRSVWHLWQMGLQQHKKICALEDQSLNHGTQNPRGKAFPQLERELQFVGGSLMEKESKASLHFMNKLKKKSLHGWQCFVSIHKHKKAAKAQAEHFVHLHLMRMSWSVWRSEWHRKQSKEERLRDKELPSTLLRPTSTSGFGTSSENVTLDEEKAGVGQIGCQYHYQRLQVINKHWTLCKDELQQAEDETFQALSDMALKNYRKHLLSHCFDHWRMKIIQQRRMKAFMEELEWRADIWFAEHFLARYFNLWLKYISQRRLKKERRHKADVFNKQRLCTYALSTWRKQSDEHNDEMLSLRIAILHEERILVQKAWLHWRKQTDQHIGKEDVNQQSSEHHFQRLPSISLAPREDDATESHFRKNEQQVYSQGDRCHVTWALERWKKFVKRQKMVKCSQEHCEVNEIAKSLKLKDSPRTFELTERALWHWALTLQAKVLYRWRLWVTEQRSKTGEPLKVPQVNKTLLLKDFHAWREETTLAVFEKRKALNTTQSSVNQVDLLQKEQKDTEKARKHYNSTLLRKLLRAWRIQYKVMKEQGILFQKRKMYQTYFAQWRSKLQLKLKVSEQTEQALWHWALTLQAKVLYAWRLWVTEQRRRKTETLGELQMDKDMLQTMDVTYSDDKINIRSLPEPGVQQDEEPLNPRLQRLLKRVAKKWKERVLSKPLKKTVTFNLPELKNDLPSKSGEHDVADSILIPPLMRRQPRRCEELFEPSFKVLSYDGARCQYTDVIHSSPQKCPVSIVETPQPQRELLLPPSTFMSAKNKLEYDWTFSPTKMPNLKQILSTPAVVPIQDLQPREQNGGSETDTTSSLLRELMSIQQDMRHFQQERKQLRLWQRVKDVLQGWLQTSGKDEEMDSSAVWQQVKELEERIEKLSCELGTRKLTMRLHVERLQHLQAVLDCSGFSSLYCQMQMQT
ncbi:uncharacterized protein sfi1 isoform X2 [Stigmatopora argus]